MKNKIVSLNKQKTKSLVIKFLSLMTSSTLFCLSQRGGVLAESQKEDLPPSTLSPNTLEIQTSEPIIPNLPENPENLTPLQREQVKETLEKLDLEALGYSQLGNPLKAFQLWHQEWMLSRYLGTVTEIQTLSRIAQISWEQGQKIEVQLIRQRLETILTESLAKNPVNLEHLQLLASAFQQTRSKADAVMVYQKIIELAHEKEDILTKGKALKSLGNIHLKWLSYEKAAVVYEDLARLIQENREAFLTAYLEFQSPPTTPAPSGNSAITPTNTPTPEAPPTEEETLKNLVYVYDQSGKSLQAIASLEKLIAFYTNLQNLKPIPTLKSAIASHYQSLGKRNLASQYYQESYTLAIGIQQFAIASEALEKLANLYSSQKQWEAALKIYQMQLTINQQSYNLYGTMSSYDKIGQMYVQMKQDKKALNAFQEALQIANQLGHGQEIFTQKIAKINRRLKGD